MNKTKLIISIGIIGILAIVGIVISPVGKQLGQTLVAPDYWTNATNSSSSVPATATTTSPILSLDASRNNAVICNNGKYPVFLHPMGISTTTGVAVNKGIPLSPIGLSTSTANVCIELPNFRGYLFGISSVATFVTVTSW